MTVIDWMNSPGMPVGEWVMWSQLTPGSVTAVSALRQQHALQLVMRPTGLVEASLVSTAWNVPGDHMTFQVQPETEAAHVAVLATQALTDALWKPFFRAAYDLRARRNPVMDMDTALLNQALAKVLNDISITDPHEMTILTALLANDGGRSMEWYLTNIGFSPDDIRFIIDRVKRMIANTDPARDNLVSAALAEDDGVRLGQFLGNAIGNPEAVGGLLEIIAQDAQNTDPSRENLISALMARDGGRRLKAYLENSVPAMERIVELMEKITASVNEHNPAHENALSVLMAKDGGRRLRSYFKRNGWAGFKEAIYSERVALVVALVIVGVAIAGLAVSQVWVARARGA